MEDLKPAENEEVTEAEETASGTSAEDQTEQAQENGSEDTSSPAQDETDWKAQSCISQESS